MTLPTAWRDRSNYKPISSAPRDGSRIFVTDFDTMEALMYWDGEAHNPLIQQSKGIWVADGGAFTWSEKLGLGPTHWRPRTQ